ncbi:MAG: hypothetical protein AAFO29_19285 [Actinomycetota bacterium]
MTRRHQRTITRRSREQSPATALVFLVAGWLAISGWRPDGLDQLQTVLTDWAISTGTEVLEAVARTQTGGAT